MTQRRKTKLEARGVTASHAIRDIAEFCGVSRFTVWRIAVGITPWRRSRAMILRSLLQAGWTPADGTQADVKAVLNSAYTPS